MARLPCLTRTRCLVPMIPYMRLLWSNFDTVIFIFSFSDRRSLKIENENNSTKTSTIKTPYRTRVPRVQFINIKTYAGWLELPLIGTNFMFPSLFEPLKFYGIFQANVGPTVFNCMVGFFCSGILVLLFL